MTSKLQAWRRSSRVAAILLLLLLAASALERPAAPIERDSGRPSNRPPLIRRPLTRRLFLVILDGWRRKTAFDDARMPRLAALARMGSRGPVLTGMRTFTKACIQEMFTGRPSSFADSARNLLSDPASGDSLFQRMNAARYEYSVVDMTDDLAGLFQQQWPPGTLRAPTARGVPWDVDDPAHDSLIEEATARILESSRQPLVLIHLESVDLSGHLYYPDSARYNHALRKTDERIARLVSRLDLNYDTLLVIGDHGTDDRGRHGGPDTQARETAYVAAGAGIGRSNAPLDPLDVGDTLAVLLGLCPPGGSRGAPNPAVLAMDLAELKSRCDSCLRERLAKLSPSAGLSSPDTKLYFRAGLFTPEVAELYRRAQLPPRQGHGVWLTVPLALGAAALAMLLLRFAGAPWSVSTVVLLLSLAPTRDTLAVILCAGLLGIAAARTWNLRNGAGLAAAAALLASATVPFERLPFSRIASGAGWAALLAVALVHAPRAFRPTAAGRTTPLVLSALGAALLAPLVPTDQTPGNSSGSVMLTDYALALGLLFLIAGLSLRQSSLAGLAALALAACFFHGWPLLVFALLQACAAADPPREEAPPPATALFWAPVAALALLRAINGGYGFSRMELSLAVLGLQAPETINYGWATAVILVSYLVPLLLALALAGRMTARGFGQNLDILAAAFLLFAAADLFFIVTPGASAWSAARHEETLAFDVALGLLIALLQGARRAAVAFAGFREPPVAPARRLERVSSPADVPLA